MRVSCLESSTLQPIMKEATTSSQMEDVQVSEPPPRTDSQVNPEVQNELQLPRKLLVSPWLVVGGLSASWLSIPRESFAFCFAAAAPAAANVVRLQGSAKGTCRARL